LIPFRESRRIVTSVMMSLKGDIPVIYCLESDDDDTLESPVLNHCFFVRVHMFYLMVLCLFAGTTFPSGTPDITPEFRWGSCCSIFSFMCNVLKIIVCSFVHFLLICLFIDLRLLITSLLSYNFPYRESVLDLTIPNITD
jgi:hypothetical protein